MIHLIQIQHYITITLSVNNANMIKMKEILIQDYIVLNISKKINKPCLLTKFQDKCMMN